MKSVIHNSLDVMLSGSFHQDKMGRKCSRNCGDYKWVRNFGQDTTREKATWET
jgi:hypothetical protein